MRRWLDQAVVESLSAEVPAHFEHVAPSVIGMDTDLRGQVRVSHVYRIEEDVLKLIRIPLVPWLRPAPSLVCLPYMLPLSGQIEIGKITNVTGP